MWRQQPAEEKSGLEIRERVVAHLLAALGALQPARNFDGCSSRQAAGLNRASIAARPAGQRWQLSRVRNLNA